MATLSFTKDGGRWIAEATVHNDYVVHVERVSGGSFAIEQRSTASGQYNACSPLPASLVYDAGQVIDYAFGHGVYPSGGMHVRFISGSEVTMAEINEKA